MALVIAGIYGGALFAVGLAFIYGRRSTDAKCVRKEPVSSQNKEDARKGKRDRREVAMASAR